MSEYSSEEVEAIQTVSELPPSSRVRVMQRVIERLPVDKKREFSNRPEVKLAESMGRERAEIMPVEDFESEVSQIFGEFIDLTHTERIMVVVALLKLRRHWSSVTSREVHCVLIDVGFELTNIAGFFTSLAKRRPAHLTRTSKPGAGRIRYQITELGLSEICRIASIRK